MLGTRWKWYSDSTPDNIFLIDSFVFLHKSNMIASIISTWIFPIFSARGNFVRI